MVPTSIHGMGCPPRKMGKWGGWKEHGLWSDSPTNLDWCHFNLFCMEAVVGEIKLQLLKHSEVWQNGTYSLEQEWHLSGKFRTAQWMFYLLPCGRHGIFKISRSYTHFYLVHRYSFSHQSEPSHSQCPKARWNEITLPGTFSPAWLIWNPPDSSILVSQPNVLSWSFFVSHCWPKLYFIIHNYNQCLGFQKSSTKPVLEC